MKFAPLAALALALPAFAQPIITESRFSSDRDGWTTWTDIGGSFTPTWSSTTGNPGGCISQSDPDTGYFYFRAPAKFLGNKSAALNGTLSFDMIESGSGTFDVADIILKSPGLELYYDTYEDPETSRFSRYHILLSHKALWHVGSLAGPLASPAEVQQVLANLSDILIRGEFVSGAETTRLDNVILRQPRIGLPSSTFDTDTEEWSVIADANLPVWSPAGGNPGGALQVTDIGDGRLWRYLAPCEFMGDLSGGYGGRFDYDIRTTDNNTPSAVELTIISESLRLEFDSGFVPAPNLWQSRSVPLYPTAQWKLNGNVPTPEQFLLVLSAVTQLEVKGEFSGLVDTGRLDNVFVRTGCAGDLNGDSLVDDSDFILFVSAYNILDCADPSMPAGCPSDLNSDGLVDDADFIIFVAAYNDLVCP